jgi:hypothetical protein
MLSRLLKVLAGYRHFCAHAKAIYLQVRLLSAVNCRADGSAIEGVFLDTTAFNTTNLL